MQVFEQWLERSRPHFSVLAEVWEEKGHTGVLEIVLAVGSVVLVWLSEGDYVWEDDGVDYDHAAVGAVKAA